MQLTSNASINLPPPESSLVRCVRVKGHRGRAGVSITAALKRNRKMKEIQIKW